MAESDIEKDRFLAEHADFRFREQVCYPNGGISRFYDNGIDMVVIDDGICSHEPKEPVFPYMLITEKQNDYMHRFQRVFRFLGYARENLDSYLVKDGIVLEGGYIRNTGDRSEQADASPLEIHFEEKANISAASYTRQTKNQSSVMKAFKEKEIRFLCACNMISEGWDYPELGILVMARPTLSKVLYLQQVGRGLRKTDTKKNVIVIDVVDEYGAMIKPCSMHSVFANPYYVPFGDITKMDYKPGDLVVIDGMEERIERITEVDIHSFEEKYGDYLSQEQVAREYFVNTGTITSWIRAGKLTPEVQYKFGSKTLYLFSPDEVEKYRKQLGIKEHNDATIKEDFFAFLEERDYSLSYKMPFLLAFIRHVDSIGDAKIEEILEDYIAFYQDRITRGLPVDRSTCPYNETMLQDKKAMQRSMLTNPFEKFERKRFLYYSKDLSVISMNHALYSQMEAGDWERVRRQMEEDLAEYYAKVEGAVLVKR